MFGLKSLVNLFLKMEKSNTSLVFSLTLPKEWKPKKPLKQKLCWSCQQSKIRIFGEYESRNPNSVKWYHWIYRAINEFEFRRYSKKYMETINQSANALMEVINNILDFSKIESGKLELNIEKVNVSEITNQVVDLIKYEANLKKFNSIWILSKRFLNTSKQITSD